jgi:hypothetical protein
MSVTCYANKPNVALGLVSSDRSRMQELIESFLALTRSMLISADERKWDVVAELEGQRRDIIPKLFDAPLSHQEAAHLAACLQQVLTLDRRIIDRGEAGLRELSEQLTGFDHGRRAQGAYRAAASE